MTDPRKTVCLFIAVLAAFALLPLRASPDAANSGRFWRRALDVEPGDHEKLCGLARWCLDQELPHWARVCAERVLESGVSSFRKRAALLAARACIAMGDVREGYRLLRMLSKEGDKEAAALLAAGRTEAAFRQRALVQAAEKLCGLKKYDAASAKFREALEALPRGRALSDDFVTKEELFRRLLQCGGAVDMVTDPWRSDLSSRPCKTCGRNKVPGYVTCSRCDGKGFVIQKERIGGDIARTYRRRCGRCKGLGVHICTDCLGFSCHLGDLSAQQNKLLKEYSSQFLLNPPPSSLGFTDAVKKIERFVFCREDPGDGLAVFAFLTLPKRKWMGSLWKEVQSVPVDGEDERRFRGVWRRLGSPPARAHLLLGYACRLVKSLPPFMVIYETGLRGKPDPDRTPYVKLPVHAASTRAVAAGHYVAVYDTFQQAAPPGDDSTKRYFKTAQLSTLGVKPFVWTKEAAPRFKAFQRSWHDHTRWLDDGYDYDLSGKSASFFYGDVVRIVGRLLYSSHAGYRKLFEVWGIERALTPAQNRLLAVVRPQVPAVALDAGTVSETAHVFSLLFGLRVLYAPGLGSRRVSVKTPGCCAGLLVLELAEALECSCFWDGAAFSISHAPPDNDSLDLEKAVSHCSLQDGGHVVVAPLRGM